MYAAAMAYLRNIADVLAAITMLAGRIYAEYPA